MLLTKDFKDMQDMPYGKISYSAISFTGKGLSYLLPVKERLFTIPLQAGALETYLTEDAWRVTTQG
jgi:hypothetical protein